MKKSKFSLADYKDKGIVELVKKTDKKHSSGTITLSNLDITYKTKTHLSLLDLIRNLFG